VRVPIDQRDFFSCEFKIKRKEREGGGKLKIVKN